MIVYRALILTSSTCRFLFVLHNAQQKSDFEPPKSHKKKAHAYFESPEPQKSFSEWPIN